MTDSTEKLSTNATLDTLAQVLVINGHASSKAKARDALKVAFNAIAFALRTGVAAQIKGFGRFEAVDTPARTGRNPKTGEAHAIPAGKRVKFKPSKQLLGSPETTE